MREVASNCVPDQQLIHIHQQAQPHQQQKPQSKRHSSQEPNTQLHEQSRDTQIESRKDPGATVCQRGGHPPGQQSLHAAPPQNKRSKRSSHISVGSGQPGEALQLKRKCWMQRQRHSTPACVPPSSSWWWPGDANLTIRTRTEPMQLQGVSRHRVSERRVAREDTEEGVHKPSRKLQEWHRGKAHGKSATEKVKMHGRARATPTAAGRDVVCSGVGRAFPGDRHL
jgi:hypothetical protein